jgi:ornithine cyclodeaminase/alanine dehydrogenase-like protein (mu-crystallin family)
MALIVPREVAERFLDARSAMESLRPVMVDEARGDTFHMPPFGGAKSIRRTIRTVGGGLYGLGRMGVRAGATQLFDTETGELLAIVGGTGNLRVGATMGLAAQYLVRPDARTVGLLGSGRNALPILECLKVVRPIERVGMYSPTPEHRARLAERATKALGIPVTAHDTPAAAIADADIIAVGTSSYTPVLTYTDVRPGTHVTSMGMSTELDESIYLKVDQFVAPSRDQEVEAASPISHPHVEGHLYRLVQEGRYDAASIVELGSIMNGDVAARNGPSDINLFRDSRGGVGDVAMANWVYERAREAGLGVEIDL